MDDIADTLDWTFVTGFTSLSDYEWSMNQGTDWAPVLEKPVVVGDVAKSIGHVQVRVRANSENGMPAGAQASNDTAFTELPKLPALTGGNIVVGSDQANTKYPNLISWNFLSTTIADKAVTFDKPEYYEFTVDQGASWKPVTSVPQFIGTQAYAKSNVGLRVKRAYSQVWNTRRVRFFGHLVWKVSLLRFSIFRWCQCCKYQAMRITMVG